MPIILLGDKMGRFKVDIAGIKTSNLRTLSNEEMKSLFSKMQAGDMMAKDTLVNGNLRLVLSLVQRFDNGKYNVDDLFQIGCVGLIKAVDNFDMSYNCLFSTYAVPLILGEMRRYIRDNTPLRVSRGIKDNAYQILKYKEEYIKENDREPTWNEIGNALGISLYDVKDAMDSLVNPVSIFEPIYNDGGDTIYLCDKLPDSKNDRTDKELLLTLKKAILSLKKREQLVIADRYVMGRTQEEIAASLNISQAQVSRIEKNAISTLQRIIK